jgi:hypothetical protein
VVAPQAVRNLVTNNNVLNQQHTRSSSEL